MLGMWILLRRRKLLENAADSHTSGARCVRQTARRPKRWRKRSNRQHAQLLHRTYLLATTKPEPARTQNNQKRQPTTNKNRSHETKPIKTKAVSRQARQPTETQIRNDANPDRPEIQTAEGRTEVCKTRGLCRTKHLRRMKGWLQKLKIVCAAVADERESR